MKIWTLAITGLLFCETLQIKDPTCQNLCMCKEHEQYIHIDCSGRQLDSIPRFTPEVAKSTSKLNLRNNAITGVYHDDLLDFVVLKVLDLGRNDITHLDQNALEKLVRLQKLTLKQNEITSLPPNLLRSNHQLRQFDLSSNELSIITKRHFQRTRRLRVLNLSNNKINCISDKSFNKLKRVTDLDLSRNGFSHFPGKLFDMMPLKTLNLDENPLYCDCLIKYLVTYLKNRPNLAPYVKCTGGQRKNGHERIIFNKLKIKDVNVDKLYCSHSMGYHTQCREEPVCPIECSCDQSNEYGDSDTETLDCRERDLTDVPARISKSVTTIRLEDNKIRKLGNRQFSPYHRLEHLDLSDNHIESIDGDAFYGLTKLERVLLYENKIKQVDVSTFARLSSLKILFLSSNPITCLHRDTFRDLTSLEVLTLYDNELTTLPKGIFDHNRELTQVHLGANEWNCDCHLRWLIEYFQEYQHSSGAKAPLDGSGATCSKPSTRLLKRENKGIKDDDERIALTDLHPSQLKCQRGVRYLPETCGDSCPANCVCDKRNRRVVCAQADMYQVSNDLPRYTMSLTLRDNELEEVPSWLAKFPLEELDLSQNRIKLKADMFSDLFELRSLKLDQNAITNIPQYTFSGLTKLKTLSLRNNEIGCISNQTFYPFELRDLEELDLFGNKLAEIGASTLESLSSLRNLNILSNKLNCDCLLRDTYSFLKSARGQKIAIARPKCHEPERYREFAMMDLDVNDFKCSKYAKQVSCAVKVSCPRGCTCKLDTVSCIGLGLKTIPNDIPITTKRLDLQDNNIDNLRSVINLPNLEHLDLSKNFIPGIASNRFNLPNLKRLFLANNKIKCISENAFANLGKMNVLTLNDNQVRRFSKESFPGLSYKSIGRLAISGNPLQCDCALTWLTQWIQAQFTETGESTCATPSYLANTPLLHAPYEQVARYCPTEAEIWDGCDACKSSPCLNGGQCLNTDNFGYKCACQKGYKGDRCETSVFENPCDPSPCSNGVCRSTENGKDYWCDCYSGFEGDQCNEKIDQCKGNPCPKDAVMCIDSITRPHCICPTGKLYREDKHTCGIDDLCHKKRPCKNDGICIPSPGGYKCQCPFGWKGKNCTERVNPCDDGENPCQNGADCILTNNEHDFKCVCRSENYSGKHCELFNDRPFDVSISDDPSVGQNVPNDQASQKVKCVNAGYFDKETQSCVCKNDFAGTNCSKVKKVSINAKRSYAIVNAENVSQKYHAANITFEFQTSRQNGLLLYSTANDRMRPNVYLAVEITSGFLRVRHAGSTIYSKRRLGPDQTHLVSIIIGSQNLFKLHVNKEEFVAKDTRTMPDEFQKIISKTYIGGIPADIADYAKGKGDIESTDSVIGCIGKILTNAQQVFFDTESGFFGRVSLGCQRGIECVDGEVCKNGGYCTTKRESNQSYCECKSGYAGNDCAIKLNKPLVYPNRKLCDPDPCGPHGTCQVFGNSYACQCDDGWSGKQCNIKVIDPCRKFRCYHGKCKIGHDKKPHCLCQPGYGGDHCNLRKSCRLIKHEDYFTHQDSSGKCTTEKINRDYCSTTGRSRHMSACGTGQHCVAEYHTKPMLLTCDDGSKRQFDVKFTTGCKCEIETRRKPPFF